MSDDPKKRRGKAPVGGVSSIVEMMAYMSPDEQKKLIQNLSEKDPELAKTLQKKLFTFDDLEKLSGAELQFLFADFNEALIATSLRLARTELQEKILSHLPKRKAQAVREEMEAQPPLRKSEIETAQMEIVDYAKQLEEQGKIKRG